MATPSEKKHTVVCEHAETVAPAAAPRSLWAEVVAFRHLIPHLLIIYCIVVAIGIDSGLSGLSLGIVSFRRQFGYYMDDTSGWVIAAKYQSAWSGASMGTQTVGAMLGGYLADRYGRIWPLRAAAIFTMLGTVVLVVARTIGVLIAGKAIVGLGMGFLVAQAAPFLSELAPARIRGIAVASVNISIVIGQWLSSALVWGCTAAFPRVDSNTAWLLLFGLQFVFPAIFLGLSFRVPASPVYLVQKGRVDDARAAARALYGPGYDADTHVDGIVRAMEAEQHGHDAQSISFWEAGRGTNLRRTMIGMLVVVGQVLSGNVFVLAYQAYFYELAGIAGSYPLTFGNYSIALIANLCSYLVIDSVGRRPLYTAGSFVLGIANFLVGFMSLVQTHHTKEAGAVAVFGMYLWSFTYQCTLGPTAYAIVGEVPSNRLRAKTNAWVSMANAMVSFGISYAIPYLFNPDAANLGLRMGYIFGALSFVLSALSFFFLPETKGRSAGDLDRLFDAHVPARKFPRVHFDESSTEAKDEGV